MCAYFTQDARQNESLHINSKKLVLFKGCTDLFKRLTESVVYSLDID